MDQSGGPEQQLEFTGAYRHSLDPKGRLTLPVVFREPLVALGEPKFAPSFDGRCVIVYPLPVWRELLAALRRLPRVDENAERVRRTILAQAYDCRLDDQGRALMPPSLRANAGIEREVTLVGSGDRIEVWDRGRWDEYFRQGNASLAASAKDLPL